MNLSLRQHQQKTVQEAKNKAGLWFKMRVGKTPTAIRLACTRAKSCLVICPKSLSSQWQREIETWKINDTKFRVISKEQFKKYASGMEAYQAIVVDEVHLAFGNFKNQMFKALMSYKKKYNPEYIWILSGTPFTASSWSIFSYGLLLDKPWKWYDWNKRYFNQIKMGHRMIPVARSDRDEELQQVIRSLGTVIDLKDVTDVPDDEDIIEYFSINKEQKDLIKDTFDPLPIVRFTRQHQIEQGVLKSDGYSEPISIECDKDRRIVELVDQCDKVIIVCRYHDQIKKIASLLHDTGRNIYQIHGQSNESAGDVALLAEQDPTAIVIVQGDTSYGYSLKSFSTMIFASMSYSFVNYDQMRSRMKAMEKVDGCTYIHLLTDGESVDQGVYDAVKNKRDFSIELFAHK